MGVTNKRGDVRAVRIPGTMVAFVNRVMALPPGVHTIQVIKSASGAAGIVGWTVEVGNRLEVAAVHGGNGQRGG